VDLIFCPMLHLVCNPESEPYSPECVEYAFSEVPRRPGPMQEVLCIVRRLIALHIHKTLPGAGRWDRANFALTEFWEVRYAPANPSYGKEL
jgi:hypothetical protein